MVKSIPGLVVDLSGPEPEREAVAFDVLNLPGEF
jgi:hypothetical protein